ncbi:MAG: hypothetical protein ABFR63_01035 [Thermodesulfobacteriota bacterium]
MTAMPIISVDFQKDFTAPWGACHRERPCVAFIKEKLLPHCREKGITIGEIISDYRQPRPGTPVIHCEPGSPGYQSEIPGELKHPQGWIKSMHSPVWVRENGGLAGKTPGPPYPDPTGLGHWLTDLMGPPEKSSPLVIIGLTLDCCVLCTAQELFFRGYRVEFLVEGVDCYSGSQEEKKSLLHSPLANWGTPVSWRELLERETL